jgi:CHASE2 domain-containing sensor protein
VDLALSALPVTLITVAIAAVNPFGIRDAAEHASLDVYQRLVAPAYPRDGQRLAAVVLLDDATLKRLGQTFPPDFGVYARIVDGLAAVGAEAVFLDLNFIDRRGGDEALAAFRVSLGNIPTFLAATEEASKAERCAEVRVVNLPDIAGAVRSEPHPLVRDEGRRVRLWQENPCPSWADWPPGLRPAAALELYRWHCRRQESCRGGVDDPDANPAAFGRDRMLTIEWGSAWPRGAEAVHPAYAGLPEVCPEGGFAALVRQALRLGYMGDRKPVDLLFARGCSYHPVIRAEWLLAPDENDADADAIARLLAGRVVLVGANYAGQNDVSASPVFGDVPGVMMHAMAFDNLVVRGARHLGGWPEWGIGGFGLDDVIELLLVAGMALLGHGAAALAVRAGLVRGLGIALCLVLLGAAFGVCLVALLVAWGRHEPVNWVGVVLACIVLSHPLLDRVAEAWRHRMKRPRGQLVERED